MPKGKKADQRMKPYLIYEYLMRNSDVNHVVKQKELKAYLEEFGISAERRSIYKDIDGIMEIKKEISEFDIVCHTKQYDRSSRSFHWHERYEICQVLGGECKFLVDGRLYTAGVGDIICIKEQLASLGNDAGIFGAFSEILS